MTEDELAIRTLLTEWTRATSDGRQNDVLRNHSDDVLIFDVLPPMKYEGAAAYRATWDEWQPDARGAMRFELEDLKVTADAALAFAHGMLQCGGTLPDGNAFRDTVRATFCFRKNRDKWSVVHWLATPLLDPLRSDPRYDDLVRRVREAAGLPPPAPVATGPNDA